MSTSRSRLVWTANTANFPAIGVAGIASRVDRAIAVRTRDEASVQRFGGVISALRRGGWLRVLA